MWEGTQKETGPVFLLLSVLRAAVSGKKQAIGVCIGPFPVVNLQQCMTQEHIFAFTTCLTGRVGEETSILACCAPQRATQVVLSA